MSCCQGVAIGCGEWLPRRCYRGIVLLPGDCYRVARVLLKAVLSCCQGIIIGCVELLPGRC